MAVQKMSIHRALSELKVYDDRIQKAINKTFVVANKRSNDKIQGKTIEETKALIKGNFDSYYALTENQRRIKSAVVLSNASTKVKIGGVEYTVAEAIERKAKIYHDESFIRTLKNRFFAENDRVNNENEMLPQKTESYLESVLGGKDKRTVDEVEAHTKLFVDKNRFELIDPCDIVKQIDELETRVEDFKSEVDYVLSESNATTFIEVNLVD